jgi:hypothetical protein
MWKRRGQDNQKKLFSPLPSPVTVMKSLAFCSPSLSPPTLHSTTETQQPASFPFHSAIDSGISPHVAPSKFSVFTPTPSPACASVLARRPETYPYLSRRAQQEKKGNPRRPRILQPAPPFAAVISSSSSSSASASASASHTSTIRSPSSPAALRYILNFASVIQIGGRDRERERTKGSGRRQAARTAVRGERRTTVSHHHPAPARGRVYRVRGTTTHGPFFWCALSMRY